MKKTESLLTVWVWFSLQMLGLMIYSNTFRSPLVFDDFEAIGNHSIRHLNLPILWQAFNTRFVVGISLALNYWLDKENVVGYHLFNTLMHVLNAYLVYTFVCLTFKTPRLEKNNSVDPRLLGFLTALLFLTHPLQTQAVTYIWQRATSLASFFYLGALVFYIRTRFKFSILSYALCLLFTVLGMFTKEIVFTLPLAMGLYELIFLRGLSSPKSSIGDQKVQIPLPTGQAGAKNIAGMTLLVPIFLTLLIIPWTMTKANEKTLGLVRPKDARFVHQNENLLKDLWRMTRTSSPDGMPQKDFVLTELNVLRTYLRLFLLPVNQNVDYDYPRARSLLEPNTLISFLLLFSLVVWGFFLLKNHPLLSFGIFWFFLTVSVESLVAQEEFIFEHRLYLPMVGLSLFLVSAVSYLFKKNPRRLTIILLGIIACYSFLTYQRNFVWKDEFTLWDDAVHKSPKKARVYNGRGSAFAKKGLLDEALADYNKAIELQPKFADFYINRGDVYAEKGFFDKALLEYNKAIELTPRFAVAYNNRGAVYKKMGLLEPALADCNKAIEINPYFTSAYNNRGICYENKGLLDKALADYNKAIELEPNFVLAYNNRASVYKKKGNLEHALMDCNKAIEISPDMADGYNSRAICYKDKGLLDLALLDFTHAIRLAPNDAKIYNNRAFLYFLKKDYDKSWQDVRKAQRLGFGVDPRFIEKLKNASGRNK